MKIVIWIHGFIDNTSSIVFDSKNWKDSSNQIDLCSMENKNNIQDIKNIINQLLNDQRDLKNEIKNCEFVLYYYLIFRTINSNLKSRLKFLT